MASIANSPPSFALKSCISLFPGMLENGEGNPNLAKTTGVFWCGKKHKEAPGTLSGCLQHSWPGAFSSPCVIPRLRIHQSTFAMSSEQHSEFSPCLEAGGLPGIGEQAMKTLGLEAVYCLGLFPLWFSLPIQGQWMLWEPPMLLGRAARCSRGGSLTQPFQRALLTFTSSAATPE